MSENGKLYTTIRARILKEEEIKWRRVQHKRSNKPEKQWKTI
jgi:hypothetical protein